MYNDVWIYFEFDFIKVYMIIYINTFVETHSIICLYFITSVIETRTQLRPLFGRSNKFRDRARKLFASYATKASSLQESSVRPLSARKVGTFSQATTPPRRPVTRSNSRAAGSNSNLLSKIYSSTA